MANFFLNEKTINFIYHLSTKISLQTLFETWFRTWII